MGNPAVDHMTKRLTELKTELNQLNGKVGLVKAEMAWLVASLSAYSSYSGQPIPELEGVTVSSTESLQDYKPGTSRRRRGIQLVDLVPLVRSILLEHGRPMESDEILTAGKKRGRRMGGTRENRDLTAKLRNANKDIIHIGGAGFWLVDVPCPAVGYVPAELAVVERYK